MTVHILKPGMMSSLQDRGRYGHQHLGVSPSGAMDERAHRLAHLLAGNTTDQDLASLEITVQGPSLRFDEAALFVLTGADMNASLDGQPVAVLRPTLARAGQTLTMQSAKPGQGARSYLSVYGGFQVESLLGSQSTHMRVGLGGFEGRALKKGDQIQLAHPLPNQEAALNKLQDELDELRIYMPAALALAPRERLRVMLDQADLFTDESLELFQNQSYRISPASERMGYRLEGQPLQRKTPKELLSAPTCFGTIQVPNDGQPIVLMADRQTTGGYPRIGQVISVDLAQVAQRLPGQNLGFEVVTVEQAHALAARQEQAFARLNDSLEPLRQALKQCVT
ncbi:biotin-dependent carboxyltransferase family protein [Alcaligenes phenolicus]|uniref:Biotin-dependent carboxyltransferase family protein n=1 Tax=Alcaligenes phenolicus TaxID=232846 RepID=A0AAW5VZ59_9BURK|nr:biotin-dependent carboxyltransferase family protein [Alcaligenes phenolicus]MCX5566660.1 biotin-dependent carboxyltransferase family protein [Alcaligenes phenolicus]